MCRTWIASLPFPALCLKIYTVFYIKKWLPQTWSQKQISAEQLLERDLDPPQKLRRNPAETAETNSAETPAETPQKPPQKQTAETNSGPTFYIKDSNLKIKFTAESNNLLG